MPAFITNVLHYPIFLVVVLGLIIWLYLRSAKAARAKKNQGR